VPTITAAELQDFAASLITAAGVDSAESRVLAESLVGANLRGYDSHGVMRIPFYLEMMNKGEMLPGAEFTVVRETAGTLVVDANWGIGQTQARKMADRLVEMARSQGVAVGTMSRSSHVGRLGEYCENIAAQGLVSMLMVNSHGAARRVSPPGGKVSRLATNPLAIGVPDSERPLILDFSTSATAEGKVRVKHIAGETCPDGWLIDSEGQPTNDPATLYGEPAGTILPMGGLQAYKGFGLSLMIEILTGALSGGLCAREVPETPKGNCVFMLVLDPAFFGGVDHFAKEVADLQDFVRGCPRIDGVEKITLPGDPERAVLARNLENGLTFDDENWAALTRTAKKFGVAIPELG